MSAIEQLYNQLYDEQETSPHNKWVSSRSHPRPTSPPRHSSYTVERSLLHNVSDQQHRDRGDRSGHRSPPRLQQHYNNNNESTASSSGDFETLFNLVCSDVGGSYPVMTVSSLQQFLRTVQLNVSPEALRDLFNLGGRGRKGELVYEDAEKLFRDQLTHWVPVLLARCDTFANMAEASHELDILTDEMRQKDKCLNDLEHDRHSLRREIHLTKTSSSLSIPRRNGASSVQDPSLVAALKNQEEKYSTTSSQLKAATSEMSNLASKLTSGNELVRMRSADHMTAEEQFQNTDTLLWEHNSELVEIEREYIRAKERYDDAKQLQKKLFRDKEAVEEAMRTAGRLLEDAEDMVRGVKKQKDMIQKDVEHRLQPEYDRLHKIVNELRAAINPPTADDMERAAEKDLAVKLEVEADGVTSLIERCRNELIGIRSQKEEYTQLLSRHRAWMSGSKRNEDELLLQELELCIDRAALADGERSRMHWSH